MNSEILKKLLRHMLCLALALFVGLSPAYAAPKTDNKTSSELTVEAVEAAFHAASVCYTVQHLLFSTIEAKQRGVSKAAALFAVEDRLEKHPSMGTAVELAYEVDGVTDPKVRAFYEDCMQRWKVEILKALQN